MTEAAVEGLNPFTEMINTLDLHGWQRNTLGSTAQGFCTAGAYGHLCSLMPQVFDNEQMRINMANILVKHLPEKDTIFSFNDGRARDDADVRELLKHCSQDWDAEYGVDTVVE